MAVTRAKYEFVREMYADWRWTAGMIRSWPGLGLKPWEVDALIEGIDEELRKERLAKAERRQLEIFRMPERRAAL